MGNNTFFFVFVFGLVAAWANISLTKSTNGTVLSATNGALDPKMDLAENLTKKEGRALIDLLKFKLLALGKVHVVSKLIRLAQEVGQIIHWKSTTVAPPTTTIPPPTTTSSETPVETTTHNSSKPINCRIPNDLIVIVDESWSISPQDFNASLMFTARFAEAWKDFDQNRVAIAFFSDSVRPLIGLTESESLTSSEVVTKILQSKQHPGGTAIHSAIDYATGVFSIDGRNGIRKNLILLTDGKSDLGLVLSASQRFYTVENAQGFAVGVGSAVEEPQLRAIAGGDTNKYLILSKFTELLSALRSLSMAVCK